MIYTLQDFLDDSFVPDIRALTAQSDYKSIRVTSSRIQEPPFDEFFKKGEIIISKIWGWEQDTKLMDDLILIAQEKEVAALLWALHDKSAGIPASVIQLADNMAVPLFEIPWEVNFADLQAAIFDAVREKEISSLQKIQQALFDQFFELAPIKKTASLIGRELNCAVRITDRQGGLISESGVLPKNAAAEDLISTDIEIGGYKYGSITLCPLDGQENPLYGSGERAQKYIAFPLSFWFNRQNIELMTQSRYRNDFVWDLATGAEGSRDEILSQGRYLGFDLSKPYLCVMLYTRFDTMPGSEDLYTQRLAQLTSDVEQALLEEARGRGLDIMTAHVNQSFIIYISNRPAFSESSLNGLLDAFESAVLQKSTAGCSFLWGISELTRDYSDFAVLYRQARQALTLGMHDNIREKRLFYRNTRRAMIGSVLAESEAVREGAEEVFKDLLDYDAHSKVGLMQTLMVFLSTNCNATKAAKELHLNRHSLLYRLEKIEQLTGLSLHDHEDLFVLESFALAYAQE